MSAGVAREHTTVERAAPADLRAVVVGASAGGVDALCALLPALPSHCRCAVLVVVHVSLRGPGLLAEVFAPRCRLPVREAQDKEPVLSGTVYLAPAGYHLLVEPGPQLALSVDDLVHHSRPSIDVLFESAAHVYRSQLMGIILTGANEDGAEGLAAVHAAGGFTVVQRPETAQSPRMVRSALRRARPDRLLSLEGIAALLGALPVHP